jgi:hypothetical protein
MQQFPAPDLRRLQSLHLLHFSLHTATEAALPRRS